MKLLWKGWCLTGLAMLFEFLEKVLELQPFTSVLADAKHMAI
jgi:hypothetical protein